jgi:Domain of unknown function (DUF4402)
MRKKRVVWDERPPFISLISVILLCNSGAFGQPTLSTVTNLNFGTVVSGSQVYTIPLGNASEGKVSIRGTNRRVYVTLTPPATIKFGTNSIPYTWAAAYNNTADNPTSATVFASTTANFILNARVGASYYAYIYTYGSLNLTSTHASGLYTGTFTVTASYNAGGNPSRSSAVTVSSTVIQGLTMSTSGPLNYGTVVAGTTPNVISPQTSGSAVTITASGNGGQGVTITYPATVTLSSGTSNVTFVPNLSGYPSNSQSSSTSKPSGTSVNLSGTTGNPGSYYFWLGGSLNAIPMGNPPGNYSGTFTLSATY